MGAEPESGFGVGGPEPEFGEPEDRGVQGDDRGRRSEGRAATTPKGGRRGEESSEFKSRANKVGGETEEWSIGKGAEADLSAKTDQFASEEQKGYRARSQLLRSGRGNRGGGGARRKA